MPTTDQSEDEAFRRLLVEAESGDQAAFNRMIEVVYPELKRMAHYQLAKERANHTLSTTAIVHEAYERFSAQDGPWADKAHFMRTAATIMRHLLVDYARRRNADKRGGGEQPVTLEVDRAGNPADQLAVLQLEEALVEISEIDPRLTSVIECRLFAGLSVAETAEALDMAPRTVERDWQRAKGYINRALEA
ncbi:MAG: ECF-type sigma factor [Pseudomonadales bacterium]